jgi:hypothetical protein
LLQHDEKRENRLTNKISDKRKSHSSVGEVDNTNDRSSADEGRWSPCSNSLVRKSLHGRKKEKENLKKTRMGQCLQGIIGQHDVASEDMLKRVVTRLKAHVHRLKKEKHLIFIDPNGLHCMIGA